MTRASNCCRIDASSASAVAYMARRKTTVEASKLLEGTLAGVIVF
jgi:hypothetical protein